MSLCHVSWCLRSALWRLNRTTASTLTSKRVCLASVGWCIIAAGLRRLRRIQRNSVFPTSFIDEIDADAVALVVDEVEDAARFRQGVGHEQRDQADTVGRWRLGGDVPVAGETRDLGVIDTGETFDDADRRLPGCAGDELAIEPGALTGEAEGLATAGQRACTVQQPSDGCGFGKCNVIDNDKIAPRIVAANDVDFTMNFFNVRFSLR